MKEHLETIVDLLEEKVELLARWLSSEGQENYPALEMEIRLIDAKVELAKAKMNIATHGHLSYPSFQR